MSDFTQALITAVEQSALKQIKDHGVNINYSDRINIPQSFMDDIWKMIDREALKKQIAIRLELELADRIVNKIAEELSTDIKQILSVKERRETIRALAREHLESIMKSGLTK